MSFAGRHYHVAVLNGVPKPAQRPRPPILISGGQRRMLALAGREADAVGILTTSVASGTVVGDVSERLAEAVARKIAWVREGAGERFDAIQLSLIPMVVLTDDRLRSTERMITERGWSVAPETVWQMPSVLIGPAEQIVEDMLARRERFGFSYYVVSDRQAEEFARWWHGW